MLSHSNIVFNSLNTSIRLPLVKGKSTALSFLPVCHILKEPISMFTTILAENIFESLETISDNLKETSQT